MKYFRLKPNQIKKIDNCYFNKNGIYEIKTSENFSGPFLKECVLSYTMNHLEKCKIKKL